MATALASTRVAVIGGSIGGLAAATAFHRLGATVRLFEKSPEELSKRGGSIGYCNVPLWESVRGGRMIRRGVRASRSQGAFWYGDLWRFWAEALPPGTISYGATVVDLGDDASRPTVNGQSYDLVVVADGGWSTLRGRYFGPAAPSYAGYQVLRFRVDKADVPGWDAEGQYENGIYASILMTIAADDGRDFLMGGTSFATPETEVAPPSLGAGRMEGADVTAATLAWFLPFYRKTFGHLEGGELVRAMEAAAKLGKITAQPQYEFAAASVVSCRIVLVGDAAHMASPRTAAGAHTAVLDAAALLEAFAPAGVITGDVDAALARYAPGGVRRAAELYARSREVAAGVVPAGWRPRAPLPVAGSVSK